MAYVDKDEIWNVFMNDEADFLFLVLWANISIPEQMQTPH
jgi:hypothetical protein